MSGRATVWVGLLAMLCAGFVFGTAVGHELASSCWASCLAEVARTRPDEFVRPCWRDCR